MNAEKFNFRDELGKALELGHIPKETMLQEYVDACIVVAEAYAKQQGEVPIKSEKDAIEWVKSNIPIWVKPKRKSITTYVDVFKSQNAMNKAVEHLGGELFKLLTEQQGEVPTDIERPKHIYPPTVKEYVGSIEHKSAEQQKRIEELENGVIDAMEELKTGTHDAVIEDLENVLKDK